MNFLYEIKECVVGFVMELKLTATEEVLMSIGGSIGLFISLVLGGVDEMIYALLCLTAVDYISGTVVALKTGRWDSGTGFRGLLKKAVIFTVVGICNGVDVAMNIHTLRQMAICAYCLNEAGSVLENIDMMGYSECIPLAIRNALARLKEREENNAGRLK